MGLSVLLFILGVTSAAAQAKQDSVPRQLVAAHAALDSGRVEEAITLAERYTSSHDRDPRGFLLLGDAYAARMPAGRFRALEAYRRAKQLAPRDPEPPYRLAQMGLRLGGDDGERIAREGLERVMELDPLYKDAWDDWLTLYHSAGGRRQMIKRLTSRQDDLVVRGRMALLMIEEEAYGEADHLLDALLAIDSTNVTWLAWRAQSAFEARDTLAGLVYYRRALDSASNDSTDALWRQVVGIATPGEIRAWQTGVPLERKGPWLESFWARRNPNLFAGINHRIAEHFARLRYARAHYPLLHPLVSYHRSALARTLSLEPSQGEREFNLRCEVFQALPPYTGGRLPLPGVSSVRDGARVEPDPLALLTTEEKEALPGPTRRALVLQGFNVSPTVFAPMGLDLRDVDSIAARIGYNLATGLDDRGVMYLRFGPPDKVTVGGDSQLDPQCSTFDLERWHYAAWGEVRFARPSALSHGLRTTPEMVFRPMNERQLEGLKLGVTRNASSEPAPLDFGIWTAQFRSERSISMTDVVVVTTRGEVAAALVGATGGAAEIRESATGHVTLTASPGRYALLAHARDADTVGRQELGITLRSFQAAPAVSDLLLANSWPAETTGRSGMLAHLGRDLTFGEGDAVRVYAELYGLHPDAGAIRYHVTYRILRSDDLLRDIARDTWPQAVSLEFDRVVSPSADGPVVETLDLSPQQVRRGSYLLRVEAWDEIGRVQVGRATAAFRIR